MTKLHDTLRNRFRVKNEIVGKPIEEWINEARDCGLDYGTYRALIEQGKSYAELKSIDYRSVTHSNAHLRHR